jgi:hypothetical protein
VRTVRYVPCVKALEVWGTANARASSFMGRNIKLTHVFVEDILSRCSNRKPTPKSLTCSKLEWRSQQSKLRVNSNRRVSLLANTLPGDDCASRKHWKVDESGRR